ncbi:MAG: MBL fold metallo-hydrolase, partial [Alphaproteobacteria bacterium]
MNPKVKAFFDTATYTLSYVVSCPATRRAAIIDPVLDFDARAGRTSTHSADAIIAFCRAEDLAVEWVLETHVHADHLSAGGYLKDAFGAKLGIGENVVAVQRTWAEIYDIANEVKVDGSQFDHRFHGGEVFRL